MFRLYRRLQRGEFFVVFGDCAQGGDDSNFVQFMSKTKGDIPLVLQMQGVAAEMIPHLRALLEWVFDQTGVRPVVCLERNNGGASAMHDLLTSNKLGKYTLYYAYNEEGERTDKLGWDTTGTRGGGGSRPMMLGEWRVAYNAKLIVIYDQETHDQHSTFINNKHGKPEAAPNNHDDGVISCAGAYQMYQTESPAAREEEDDYEPDYEPSNLMTS